MNPRASRPARDEAADYFFKYIDLVGEGDIVSTLEAQYQETLTLLRSIPSHLATPRYAPEKWSVNGVVAHMNDCERLFVFRALWFARGLEAALPAFDQDTASRHDAAETRTLASHVEEFDRLRVSTLDVFRPLSDEAWLRRGIASDMPFSVRALAFITAGHVAHHSRILRERYLQ